MKRLLTYKQLFQKFCDRLNSESFWIGLNLSKANLIQLNIK